MKNFSLIFSLSLCLTVLISCKDKKEQTNAIQSEIVQVNPAHGAPGHTCALPVGAPLNQQTTRVNPETTGGSNLSSSSSISPVRVNQNINTNPPHGEPGHSCSVPVGAPLATETTGKLNSSSSGISPVRIDQDQNLNPPHGAPGHSCSIPVGAPLGN